MDDPVVVDVLVDVPVPVVGVGVVLVICPRCCSLRWLLPTYKRLKFDFEIKKQPPLLPIIEASRTFKVEPSHYFVPGIETDYAVIP